VSFNERLALGALLPLELDLAVLALKLLGCRQLAGHGVGDLGRVLHVADDHTADDERAVGRRGADATRTASPMSIETSFTSRPSRRCTSSRAKVRSGSRMK
jgi:hypothetical protein